MENKYQDALNILRNIELSHNYKKLGSYLAPESDLLQELVNKEKPKKVIKFTSEITNSEEAYTFYVCPKCRMLLSNEIYCPKCGQKLDWSDEDAC